MLDLSSKIKKIKKVIDFDYILNEKENSEKIREYYIANKIAYKIFHNTSSYLHMGISQNDEFKMNDLEKQLRTINKLIKKTNSKNILELGYGHGANSYYLAKKNKELNFQAIDLSTKPSRKFTHLKNVNFDLGDYHNLEKYPDNSFDVVFAIETLCHSNKKELVLTQVFNKLKKGGLFIIYDGYLNKEKLTEEEKIACILAEKGMAVDEFEMLPSFEEKAKKQFQLIQTENLSEFILPTLLKFERLAQHFYKHKWLGKFISEILSEKIIRNTFSAYLMPNLIKEKIAVYYLHVLQKPE